MGNGAFTNVFHWMVRSNYNQIHSVGLRARQNRAVYMRYAQILSSSIVFAQPPKQSGKALFSIQLGELNSSDIGGLHAEMFKFTQLSIVHDIINAHIDGIDTDL